MNTCTLLTAGMSPCYRPGLIQIEDRTGAREWGCPGHAIRALWAIDGAHIVRDLRTEPAPTTETAGGDR